MVDFGNAGTGALTGAGIGSAFGPVGAGIGGALGAGAGLLGFGKSKQPKIKEMQNFTPEQQNILNRLQEMAQEGNEKAFEWYNRILSGDESAFAEFEGPELEKFQQETVPGVMERFNLGQSKGSSALNNSLGQAAKSLSLGLSAQRANLKNQAAQGLDRFTQTALTPRTTKYVQSGQQGNFSQLAPLAGEGLRYFMANRNQSATPGGARGAGGPAMGA